MKCFLINYGFNILYLIKFTMHTKKCEVGTKKHIAVPAILLIILTINMVDIT